MLHLETSVHFDEVVVAVAVEEKFYCTRILIAHMAGNLQGVVEDLLTDLRVEVRGRGNLHH